MVYLNRPYRFKFFKGCLSQILLDPFLNTLSQIPYKPIANSEHIEQIIWPIRLPGKHLLA